MRIRTIIPSHSAGVLARVLAVAVCAVWLAVSASASAQPGFPGGGRREKAHASATLIADTKAVEPGKPFRLGVRFEMEDEWHIYWHTPGDAGLPTEITWRLPEGYTAGPLQWPAPEEFKDSGLKTKGYGHEVVLFSMVEPPNALPGDAVALGATASWLVCKADGSCIPGEAELELALPPGTAAPSEHAAAFDKYAALVPAEDGARATPAPPVESPTPRDEATKTPPPAKPDGQLFSFLKPGWNTQTRQSPLYFLLLAFLGGLILNVMPCVLPVLSIKVLSFVRQANQDPRRIRLLGFAFTAGVLVSFLALAVVVVGVRAAGAQVGWGFQMQEPRFVILMSAVVLAFGLSLFGVFEIELPGVALQGVEGLQYREGPAGAFFNGALATALATPCTAPLLGPALTFAFGQPPHMIILFFTIIAMGLAFPYLLLSLNPRWLRFVPKPGGWMNTFKQFMGFLLLATVVWLMSVLGGQTGPEGIVWTLAFLTCVALACWIFGVGFGLHSGRGRKVVTAMLALSLLAGGYAYFAEGFLRDLDRAGKGGGESEVEWLPFSVELVEKTAAEGRTMILDFTAEWCVTCKVNEKTALASAEFGDAVRRNNVVAIKADWTRRDPVIGEALRLFGRSGVPLYVVLPGGRPGEPILLPDGYITTGAVVDALGQAAR